MTFPPGVQLAGVVMRSEVQWFMSVFSARVQQRRQELTGISELQRVDDTENLVKLTSSGGLRREGV